MNKLFKKICCLSFVFLFLACGFCMDSVFAVTKSLKVTFVGSFNSGKTALRCRVLGRPFNFQKRDPSRRSHCISEVMDYDRDTKLLCQFWDTSGDLSVKDQILSGRIKGSHIVVIVVDMSCKPSQAKYDNAVDEAIKEWYGAVRENSPLSEVMIVGTKIDLIPPAERDKAMRKLEAANTLYDHFSYILTSAKTGEGISEFFNIVRRMIDVSKLPAVEYTAVGEADDADAPVCKQCKKKYVSSDIRDYCGRTCYEKAHEVKCKYCGNMFYPGESGGDGYCGEKCRKAGNAWFMCAIQ